MGRKNEYMKLLPTHPGSLKAAIHDGLMLRPFPEEVWEEEEPAVRCVMITHNTDNTAVVIPTQPTINHAMCHIHNVHNTISHTHNAHHHTLHAKALIRNTDTHTEKDQKATKDTHTAKDQDENSLSHTSPDPPDYEDSRNP